MSRKARHWHAKHMLLLSFITQIPSQEKKYTHTRIPITHTNTHTYITMTITHSTTHRSRDPGRCRRARGVSYSSSSPLSNTNTCGRRGGFVCLVDVMGGERVIISPLHIHTHTIQTPSNHRRQPGSNTHPIVVGDGGEAVRDAEDGGVVQALADRLLDAGVRHGVHVGGGLLRLVWFGLGWFVDLCCVYFKCVKMFVVAPLPTPTQPTSSITTTAAPFNSARAKHSSCRSPTLQFAPPSATPCASEATDPPVSLARCTRRSASHSWASECCPLRSRLLRMVPFGVCGGEKGSGMGVWVVCVCECDTCNTHTTARIVDIRCGCICIHRYTCRYTHTCIDRYIPWKRVGSWGMTAMRLRRSASPGSCSC